MTARGRRLRRWTYRHRFRFGQLGLFLIVLGAVLMAIGRPWGLALVPPGPVSFTVARYNVGGGQPEDGTPGAGTGFFE